VKEGFISSKKPGCLDSNFDQTGRANIGRKMHLTSVFFCFCLSLALASAATVSRDTREAEEVGAEESGGATTTVNSQDLKSEEVVDETADDEDEDDVVITADDASEQIKEENVPKCSKCLKNSFRYRHDGFCGKCVNQDVIDVAEQEQLEGAIKCRKCSKPKFRSRNALLCSDICQADIELPVPIATKATPIKFQEKEKEEEMSIVKKEIVKKDTLMEKKEEKQAKKSKKKEAREKRRKEKQERKLAKKNKKFGYPPNSPGWTVTSESSKVSTSSEDPVALGPLGYLFQALIVANTW